MSSKVRLSIFDRDNKVRTSGLFELTEDGSKIRVKSGGTANWNPELDNDSCLYFRRRKWYAPWIKEWIPEYYVRKNATKCVNFKTESVDGPDLELVEDVCDLLMMEKLNKSKAQQPLLLILVAIFIVLLGVAGKVFGVIR